MTRDEIVMLARDWLSMADDVRPWHDSSMTACLVLKKIAAEKLYSEKEGQDLVLETADKIFPKR